MKSDVGVESKNRTETVCCWKLVKEDGHVLGTPYFNTYPELTESQSGSEIRIVSWEVVQ